MPLIVHGARIEIPGLKVVDFTQDTSIGLAGRTMCSRRRKSSEAVTLVVFHTTHGWPDREHTAPQSVKVRPATHADLGAASVIADWRKSTTRFAGAQLVVDADGTVYCTCDLATVAAYHAGHANGCSVGVEFVQQRDASLFRAQVDAAQLLAEALCVAFGLRRRVAYPYSGPREGILSEDGFVGHRELTEDRSSGDPGDFLLGALASLPGWATF